MITTDDLATNLGRDYARFGLELRQCPWHLGSQKGQRFMVAYEHESALMALEAGKLAECERELDAAEPERRGFLRRMWERFFRRRRDRDNA